MNVESSLYRELTDAELRAVIAEALHTTPVHYHLLAGGLFNTTYYVETADCGKVVLRMGPVNRHLLMPFEHYLMEAEGLVYDICAQHGIPASEVLAMSTDKALLDRDYMIVRYIPSITFKDAPLSEADHARLYREFGQHVAAMHRITRPRFGRIQDVERGGGFDRWSECLRSELEEYIRVAAPYPIFVQEDFDRLREIYRLHAPLLDTVKTSCLVHTDLGPGNVLIRNDGPTPAFGAIIDPDRAMWGDTEFDFCLIDWMLTDDFIAGYGAPIFTEDPRVLRRRTLCRLTRLLWDTYVWEVEYHKHEYMLHNRRVIREMIDELLADPITPEG